jgi:hypothetical protein
LETTYYLFLRCSFATMCWTSIGITPLRVANPQRAVTRMPKQLRHRCAMEIVILMSYRWIFEGIPPTVDRWRQEKN